MQRGILALATVLGLSLVGPVDGAVDVQFTFSGGGGGSIAFDGAPTYSNPSYEYWTFADMDNFQADFTVGSQSWNETQILGKYWNPLLSSDNVWLLHIIPTDDWYFDDNDDGSGDHGIVYFNNGIATLYIDEGDWGDRTYSIAGPAPQSGTYRASSSEDIPEPSALALWTGLAALGSVVVWRRCKRSE